MGTSRGGITKRQRAIVAAIKALSKELGYAPTVSEIGHRAGIQAKSTLRWHLDTLERSGYIARSKGIPRSTRIVETEPTS